MDSVPLLSLAPTGPCLKESDLVTRGKENGIVAARESNSQEKIKLSIKYPESSFVYKIL